MEYRDEAHSMGIIALKFGAFMEMKPWMIKSCTKLESCVCVYHREAALMMKALNEARSQMHAINPDDMEWDDDQHTIDYVGPYDGMAIDNTDCKHHKSCPCKCQACVNKPTYLTDFTDSLLCRRTEGSRLYKLKCVLRKCIKCGWDKIQGACDVDINRVRLDPEKHVQVQLLQRVTKAYGGVEKRIKAEVITSMTYDSFLKSCKSTMEDFVIHDHIARWQASQYHSQIRNLEEGREIWVIDFIENYKVFSKVELQQDYYNKSQVSNYMIN